jgi:hypothetical protein
MYFGYYGKKPSLTPRKKRLLRQQEITSVAPGTIVHDFDAMLAYVRERPLRVTGTHQLPLRSLSEINARLAQPVELGLKRPQQKSYPPIHGLYLLLRASGLTYLDESGSKPMLLVDEDLAQVWTSLSPVECYCTLLETWLLRATVDILGERSRFGLPEHFEKWYSFSLQIPDEGLNVAENKDEHYLSYTPGWHNVGLLPLFGLVTLQAGPPVEGERWQIQAFTRTSFGEALLALLYEDFFSDFDNIQNLAEAESVPAGVLQPVLQPYFTGWQRILALPEQEETFKAGAYVFKVSLGKQLWRRLVVSGEATLDDLAAAILNAYRFDHDHLYYFAFETRQGTIRRYNHPYMDEGPWASEVRLGDLPLRLGQTLEFLYDFGDQWEFAVNLERITPVGDAPHEPQVIESKGRAPKQYW